MSRTASVSNWQGASFKGVDFSKYVTEWTDTREYGLAQHQYLKRAGAEQEEMGREPHVTQVTLSYCGPSWYNDFMTLAAELDRGVKGVFVHPLFGQMRAACHGFANARMNVEQAANLYVVPLVFIEDQIDTQIAAPTAQGPAVQAQWIAAYGSSLVATAAKYATAALAVGALVDAANSYAAAAVSAALSQTADTSLSGQLSAMVTLSATARDAVRADPADTLDAPRYTTVALIEQVLDACRQLDASVRSFRPTLALYTLPARVSLAKLAHQFYGSDGLARMSEILANNPGLVPDPWGIAPGTQIWMATATNPRF